MSFVLSNHNMSGKTIKIVNDLRQFRNAEIVVLDDGSTHDHTRALLDHLNGVNEFVLHANDLFDVIVFNRTLGFAQGEFVAIIQDDDEYKGKEWARQAMEIFHSDPKLAVLGGRDWLFVSGGGVIEVGSSGPFRYVQAVNAAPLWLRRNAFLELGGFGEEFAPMLWHETDLCMRAWMSGYHVGWYKSGASICSTNTQERRSQKAAIEGQSTRKNFDLIMSKYGSALDRVQKMADRMNT